MKDYYYRTTCRICGSKDLKKFLDLGITPLANSFVKKTNLNKKEREFPLSVYFCQNCSLAQIPNVVNPKILFGNYYFITSSSSPLLDHFRNYGKYILQNFVKSDNGLVIDIGGNDGTLLNELKNNFRVLNIEPAKNIAEISVKKGIKTVNDFFSKELVAKILKYNGPANIVTANNIIAHTDAVKELFEGVMNLLTPDGVFIFETHWVGNLIEEACFDQVYHEHLCFYSLHALKYLAESVGLNIFDVKVVSVQGESLRVCASKSRKQKISVKRFLKREKEFGLNNFKVFSGFSKRVLKNKEETLKMLASLKDQNKKIVGYGAPAKGSTLLNFYGINSKTLDYVIDTTSIKQGLFIPGVHIPIYSPERLYKSKPDYIFLLAWNYANAILEKEKELRKKGVKFIIPVPHARIV